MKCIPNHDEKIFVGKLVIKKMSKLSFTHLIFNLKFMLFLKIFYFYFRTIRIILLSLNL